MIEPSRGICYGCRHDGDERFSTSGHCHGTGSMIPEEGSTWPGFICICPCAVGTDDVH